MSQNKYMHPRNIYKIPPNFKDLAILYPDFRKFAKQDIKGKVTIDFKDQEALRILTTTLLQKDFGLQVEIPPNRLVPTLPLRLNYLLWIEDIMQLTKSCQKKQIYGIDIGTGASCIYPLLAAKTQKWKMLATELDIESVNWAKKNVESNGLGHLITVKQVDAGTILNGVLNTDVQYDFTMCNPPFFSSEKEADSSSKSRSDSRPLPHNVKTGSVNEMVVEGGERLFILQMIHESAQLKNAVRVYTTMIGQKSSLKQLKSELEKVGAVDSTLTEFCQGHTTRWGLAWTFIPEVKLETIPRTKKKKDKPPMKYVVPAPEDPLAYTVTVITNKLKQLLSQLEIECKDMQGKKQHSTLEITARKNTWSHQRRKRREQKLQPPVQDNKLEQQSETKTGEIVHDSDKATLVDTDKVSLKRKFEMEDGNFKKIKFESTVGTSREGINISEEELKLTSVTDVSLERNVNSENASQTSEPLANTSLDNSSQKNEESYILKSIVSIKTIDTEIHIEMGWLDGQAGRDALHQVMQYIKNNLKIV